MCFVNITLCIIKFNHVSYVNAGHYCLKQNTVNKLKINWWILTLKISSRSYNIHLVSDIYWTRLNTARGVYVDKWHAIYRVLLNVQNVNSDSWWNYGRLGDFLSNLLLPLFHFVSRYITCIKGRRATWGRNPIKGSRFFKQTLYHHCSVLFDYRQWFERD